MPERHLLDVLKNVHHEIQYTRHFGPPSGSDPKLPDAVSRYLFTIFGYASELGATQTARHTQNLIGWHTLRRLNTQHITTEKLEAALRDVINDYTRFELPFFWGSGQAAIADGTHIELLENNLLGAQHIRYGKFGGIAYPHISDTYIALFSHFIACGVWEAVYILDGLLKNKSELQPDTLHADTHGQSVILTLVGYTVLREGCGASHRAPLYGDTTRWCRRLRLVTPTDSADATGTAVSSAPLTMMTSIFLSEREKCACRFNDVDERMVASRWNSSMTAVSLSPSSRLFYATSPPGIIRPIRSSPTLTTFSICGVS
jgi:hypothetical protein